MRSTASLGAALLYCSLLTPADGATTGNFGLFVGKKVLDNSGWENLDSHLEFAILADFRETNWPVSIAIGMAGSADVKETAQGDVTGTTGETFAGIRKLFAEGSRVQPYLGGGLALIDAEIDTPTANNSDGGFGFWLNAGVYFHLTEHFSLAVDYRHSQADLTITNEDIKGGGDHLGITAGYHW